MTAPSWRVRTHGADAYVAQRGTANDWKISLHASGEHQTSIIVPAVERYRDQLTAGRHLDRWDRPPEFSEGWTALLHIVHPHRELAPITEAGTSKCVSLEVGPGYALHIWLFRSRPTVVPTSLNFDQARHLASVDLADDTKLEAIATIQPWGYQEIVQVNAARREMIEGSVAALMPPCQADTDPSVHVPRMVVGGVHTNGLRYFVEMSASPISP